MHGSAAAGWVAEPRAWLAGRAAWLQVELAPGYAEAWCNMGVMHKQQVGALSMPLEGSWASSERTARQLGSPSVAVAQHTTHHGSLPTCTAALMQHIWQPWRQQPSPRGPAHLRL